MPVVVHELLHLPDAVGHLGQTLAGDDLALVEQPLHRAPDHLDAVFGAELADAAVAGAQRGDLAPHVALRGGGEADVRFDHVGELGAELPAVDQLDARKAQALLEDLGGVGRKGAGGHAADVRPVGLVAHEGDDLAS